MAFFPKWIDRTEAYSKKLKRNMTGQLPQNRTDEIFCVLTGYRAPFVPAYYFFLEHHKGVVVQVAPSGKVTTHWLDEDNEENDMIPFIEEARKQHKPVLYVPDMPCNLVNGACDKTPHYFQGSTVRGFEPFDIKHGKMIQAGGVFLEKVGIADVEEELMPFISRNISLLENDEDFVRAAIQEFCLPEYDSRMNEFLSRVERGEVGKVYT